MVLVELVEVELVYMIKFDFVYSVDLVFFVVLG